VSLKNSVNAFSQTKKLYIMRLKFYEMINSFLLLNSFCNSFFGYLPRKISKKIKKTEQMKKF